SISTTVKPFIDLIPAAASAIDSQSLSVFRRPSPSPAVPFYRCRSPASDGTKRHRLKHSTPATSHH
ncbi:hypothetical protein LINPERPRIM_LOCUS19510, partial [Linum perenne]